MNRRSAPRAKVDVLINRFLDGHPYMCRMIDISPTGLRLVPLLEPRYPCKFMGLQFQLPGVDTVLTASAETIYGPGSGATAGSTTGSSRRPALGWALVAASRPGGAVGQGARAIPSNPLRASASGETGSPLTRGTTGVKFTSLSPENALLIRRFVESN